MEYIGFRITQAGLSTLPSKVEAVLKAPTPRNVTELKSFLGLVNYYGRFLAILSSVCHPLNRLLQKEVKWTWSEECEKCFQRLKESLVSAQVLMHYDVSLPVRLACDASAYGIGAVISHVLLSGELCPVAYASRSLSKAEVNYSQIEKEALALTFGVRRFHQSLKFVLVTDHKPLVTIFGSKQSIPPIAAARLQRWSIILAGYRYEIEYKRTQDHSNADGLSVSRLPVGPAESEEVSTKEAGLFDLSQIKLLPVTSKELAAESRKDPILSQVTDSIINGWASRVDTGDPINPYFVKQEQLTIECGCILFGMRVVVPPKLQETVLSELHEGHSGIVQMKSIARTHVWWPHIDQQIERIASCDACQRNKKAPPTVLLHPWIWPSRPMQRVHVDFAGPFMGTTFLLMVDSRSKWLEVIPMQSTTAKDTIDVLRNLFARYGLSQQLVSDNGTQFVAAEFQDFAKENSIKHIRSALYHPASNGQVERAVQTLKAKLKAMENESGSLLQKLSR